MSLLLFLVCCGVWFLFRKVGESFVNSGVQKVREYLEEVILKQVGYLIDYHRNMKTLRTEVEKLGIIKKDVEHSVHEAQNNGQRIGDGVYSWLKTVDQINEEVNMLEDEATANKSWLNGWCPDLLSRYSLSWKAKKKTQIVIGLQRDNTRFILADFFSRIKIMDEIMEALKDDNINAIGICGLGGVGKTTMVKKLRKRANLEKLFDEIVMMVVGQNADPEKIQAEIAQRLDLYLEEKDDFLDRADKLQNKLMDGQRRLVILDDVWEMLDLEAIGIPFGGVYMACKVMVTSRSQDVCRGMKKVPIGVLPEEEAWSLFKEKAGNSIEDSPNLCEIAKKVVKECGGLPIAIVTVGAALKGKEAGIWEDALLQLKMHFPENISGLTQDVYRSIQLSYNSLESQEAKSCLLLCCLFEEDTDIWPENLVRYGMGLGLFRGIDTMTEARKRVCTLVDKLKGCYLLLDGELKEYFVVKVHDVVRDVIRSKATEGEEAFMFGDDQLCKELATKHMGQRKYLLILNSNNIDLLLLKGMVGSWEEVDNLFEGIKELKVLDARISNPSILTSLSSLTKLRTLCLPDSTLGNISPIGELKTLVILILRHSIIRELPTEIGNLSHLKLLDLTGCQLREGISPGVISNLKQLEELYSLWNSVHWVVGEEGKQKNEVNLEELVSLRNLIALRTLLPTADFPGSNSLFKNLLSFQIIISPVYDCERWQGDQLQNRLQLNLDDTRIPVADSGINELLTKTDALFLKLYGVKKVLDDPTPLNHVQLRHLEICSWEGAEYLFDTVDLDPHLKLLESKDVHNLKRTCHGKLPTGSFKELRDINVHCCNRLKNLFSPSIAEGLVQLKSLTIGRCKIMEEIIATKRREHGESTNKIRFPKLTRLWLVNLPSLVSFYKSMEEIEFPQLIYLTLEGLPKIGSLFPNSLASQGKHDTATQCLSNEKVICPSMEFHGLRFIQVQGCNKLLNIAQSDLLQGLSNLEQLTVVDCASLVHVFEVEVLNVEESDIVPLSKLKELCLVYLPELTHILKREPKGILFFQSLTVLYIWNCNNLRNLFSAYMAKSAEQLQELVIDKCEMLEEIITKGENEEEYRTDKITMPQLKRLKLCDLPNLTSFCQDLNAFDLPSLKHVAIERCPKMKTSPFGFASIPKPTKLEYWQVTISESRCESLIRDIAKKQWWVNDSFDDSVEVFKVEGLNIEKVTFPSTELHELRKIHVQGCNKLLNVVPSDLLQGLMISNLEELAVIDCASLVEVFEVEGLNIEKVIFPSTELHGLRRMHVQGCNKLLNVVPSDLLQGFCNLEELTVADCASLVEVFEVEVSNVKESDIVPFSKFKELYLVYLPELTHILKREPKGILFFQSLTVLCVWNCNNLRNLFSTSMARSAKQLQELCIEECEMIEEIVIKGENEEEYKMDKITMPQLKKLTLCDLPNLTSFCRDLNVFGLPSLKHMAIKLCPKMKTFPFGLARTPKPTKLGCWWNTTSGFKYENLVHNIVKKQLEVNHSFDDDGDDSFDDYGNGDDSFDDDGDGDGDNSSDDDGDGNDGFDDDGDGDVTGDDSSDDNEINLNT